MQWLLSWQLRIYVSLVAETSDLARDLRRDLERAGDQAGRQAGEGFADQFTRQTRGMDRDVSRRLGDTGGDEGRDAGRRFSSGFSERLSGIGDSIGDRLGGAADRVSGMAGDSGGASFLSGFSGQIGSLGSKAGPIGAALAGVAAIGVSAGAVLAGAIADGMQQQQQRDLIQARLGVNESTMEVIGTAAGNAFSNAWGESVQANMTTAQLAIQSGILNGEETAGEMQPVIEGLQGVTDLMGGEMSDTVRAVSALMKNDLVDSAEDAFDVITLGYQRGGNIGDDLIDSMSEYSAGWKQTGLSAEFALGLINQSMENGADNTDRGADALREFGRRMYEESDTIKEAFTDLGFSADEMYARLKAGGPDAEKAFDEIFDAIRVIPEPTERAAAAQKLLGDTAGDFIGAFTQWDPSKAAASFGVVEGAAKSARDVMGSNPMSEWTSSMNTIKVEADSVKLALADMAGPYLSQLAEWVSTHKPEIIGFFTGLVDGALLAGEGIARFVQGALNVIGPFAAIAAEAFAGVLDTMGFFVSAAAKVAGALGMDGLSSDLEGAQTFLNDYADKSRGAASGMLDLADTIGEDVIPALSGMREDFKLSGQQAQDSATLMRALGDDVKMIPDSKRILIEDNTPERRAELEKLGLQVRELPDGTFEVFANTAEGQRIVDNFIAANTGRTIGVWVDGKFRWSQERSAYNRQLGMSDEDFARMQNAAQGGFATGGYFTGAGTGTSDSNLIRISDGEFITQAAMTKKHRGLLEAINNDDIPAFAEGGVVRGKKFAQSMDPATYLMGGFSRSSIDCSGMVAATVNDIMGINPFDSRMSTVNEGAWLAAKGFQPGRGKPGDVRVGWYDNGGGAFGHTAMTLEDGTNVESNGSQGVVIGGAVGADDPMFDQHMFLPGQYLQGGDLGAGASGGSSVGGLSPLGSGSGGGFGGGSGGGSGSGGAGGASSNAVSVFVTNWPNGLTTVEQVGLDGTTTASTDAPASTAEAQTAEVNPYEERLRQYGEQMAGIGQNAALEILGVQGTLLDPNHRFWTAGREIAQAFSQRGASTADGAGAPQSVDNSVTVQAHGLIDNRIVDEIARRVAALQSRNSFPHMGRPL